MSKPDYASLLSQSASLLAQIEAEDDATAKQALITARELVIDQIVMVASVADDPNTTANEAVDNSLTNAEIQLFEYVEDEYIPNDVNGIKYAGKEII
jgi:hypothetical protein